MRSKRQRERELKKVQEKQAEIRQRQEAKALQKRKEHIIASLQEKNRRALMQIGRIIERLGIDFAEQKLAEAEKVEEQGGLMVEGLKRRRTKGGVFFFLVKKALREAERREDLREIFYKHQFDWLRETENQEKNQTASESRGKVQTASDSRRTIQTTSESRGKVQPRRGKIQTISESREKTHHPVSSPVARSSSTPLAARKVGEMRESVSSETSSSFGPRGTLERKKSGSRFSSVHVQESRQESL